MPAALVVTEPFVGLAAGFAATLGVPGYAPVVVPHPISTRDDADLDRIVDRALDDLLDRFRP